MDTTQSIDLRVVVVVRLDIIESTVAIKRKPLSRWSWCMRGYDIHVALTIRRILEMLRNLFCQFRFLKIRGFDITSLKIGFHFGDLDLEAASQRDPLRTNIQRQIDVPNSLCLF